MAKARKRRERSSLKPTMVKHLRALGLATVEDYLTWCRRRGLDPSLDKSPYERAEELEVPRREAARAREVERIHRNPRRFIERACAGEITPKDINRPGWREVCTAIAKSKPRSGNRKSLCDFLVFVEEHSSILRETARFGRLTLNYVDGVIALHDRKAQWIRELKDWRSGSRHPESQFSSLARHLLARYPVPQFLDGAWMRPDKIAERYRDWFVHIGSGENLRTADTLYPMAKKQVHHFLGAPDRSSIEDALLWGEIHALGGDRRLTEAILATRLGNHVESNEKKRAFWASVFRFFIDHPMLNRRHVGPIIDYLNFHKYQRRRVVVGRGRTEVRPPPQPNLSMNRRTPEGLLRQVDQWHGTLRTARLATNLYFPASGFSGLTLETGPTHSSGRKAQWRIRELLSGAELFEEGRRMQHCVVTYAYSCARGDCSIWTLERRHVDGGVEKHLTLELDRNGVLVEARGRQNRRPTDREMVALDAWVRAARLKMGRYVGGEY